MEPGTATKQDPSVGPTRASLEYSVIRNRDSLPTLLVSFQMFRQSDCQTPWHNKIQLFAIQLSRDPSSPYFGYFLTHSLRFSSSVASVKHGRFHRSMSKPKQTDSYNPAYTTRQMPLTSEPTRRLTCFLLGCTQRTCDTRQEAIMALALPLC
jgi:hypothetical protein